MSLIVNGEPAEVATPITIAGLLVAIDAPQRGVAVAVDGAVVPRGEWVTHALQDGARVEVLTAVQGG